jgi:predicted nicotinamide N-methyase
VQEWFEPPYDAVIATDVAYALNAHAALVCTLAAASDTKTAVYIGHEHRWRDIDAWFLEELDVAFSVACVPLEEFPVEFRSPNTSIYTLTLKDMADSDEVEDSYF